MAEEALLEAYFALLSAKVRYHQEIVWLSVEDSSDNKKKDVDYGVENDLVHSGVDSLVYMTN